MSQPPLLPRITLYILGVYHFDGAVHDVVDTGARDVLTPHFQAQIAEVVEGLQQSKADKIFVEWKVDQQALVDATYAQYLKDEFILGTNEVFQLGYRLAKALGHTQIYCADAEGEWEYDQVLQYAAKHKQQLITNSLFTHGPLDETGLHIARRTGKTTPVNKLSDRYLSAQLKELNATDSNLINMDLYMLGLTRVGSPTQYPGADLVGEVFKRNIRIYSNILNSIDIIKDQTILLIIGHGHVAFIRSILSYNSLFLLKDASALLP